MRVLKSDTAKVLAVTLALLGSLEALVRVTGLGATPADVAAGQFVNVTDQGLRCNVNGSTDCAVRGGRDEIRVFGGSAKFGYGVNDDETIPAYLDQMTPGYRVLNFGVASNYSTIKRIPDLNLLTQYDPSAAVIFIDGLNNIYYNEVPGINRVTCGLTSVPPGTIELGVSPTHPARENNRCRA